MVAVPPRHRQQQREQPERDGTHESPGVRRRRIAHGRQRRTDRRRRPPCSARPHAVPVTASPGESVSVHQLADHGVGQQPTVQGQPQPVIGHRHQRPGPPRRPPEPGRGPTADPAASPPPTGSPAAPAPAPGRPPRAPRAPAPVTGPGGQPGGVRGRVLDVPPAHAADVAVRAGPDAPPVAAAPVDQVVPARARPGARPSWTPRTSVEARRRTAARRPAGTGRPGRRRRAAAARRGAPGPPAACRPRRSGRTR